jgi:hypothetical protein
MRWEGKGLEGEGIGWEGKERCSIIFR